MKLWLQIIVFILSLIPAGFGTVNALMGVSRFMATDTFPATIDSQFRFQSAIYFGLAMLIWWVIPRIDTQTAIFRIVVATVFLGGLARLLSYLTVGDPGPVPFGAMILELAIPLLLPWQAAIRKTHDR